MKLRSHAFGPWVVFAGLAMVLAGGGYACRKASSDPKPALAGPLSLESVKTVLGAAGDFASGAVDLTKDGAVVVIAFRFYDPDRENYETDFATELAPRIQALYQRFPEIDQIRLDVIANDPDQEGMWKPFVELVLDRKTITEIRWTGFLARYLLDRTIASRR